MRLECDFPVIGGQQGSLLGLCVFTESRMVLQSFPCLRGEGWPQLGPAGPLSGWAARAAFGAAGQWQSLEQGQQDLGLVGLKAVAEVRQRKAVIPACLQRQKWFVLPSAAVHPPDL